MSHNPLKFGSAPSLSVTGLYRGLQPEAGHALQHLILDANAGMAPRRAAATAQARRRAVFTAAVILPSARSPLRAILSSVCHAVGSGGHQFETAPAVTDHPGSRGVNSPG